MTAILTKQNAIDGAFVGGNGGGSSNGEFESINVKNDATINGDILVNAGEGQMIKVNDVFIGLMQSDQKLDDKCVELGLNISDHKIKLDNHEQRIDNHEQRIETLETTKPTVINNLRYEDGLDDFIISASTLSVNSNDNIRFQRNLRAKPVQWTII